MRYLFLASLAVSDFVIAALIVPFHVASKVYEELEFSTTQCKVIMLLTRALYCSTTLHMIAVSYDRYLAIVKSPLTYSQRITKAKILLLMAFAWILPFATAAGPWFTIWEDTFPFSARLYHCDMSRLGCPKQRSADEVRLLFRRCFRCATVSTCLAKLQGFQSSFTVRAGNHNTTALHSASTKQMPGTQGRQRCRRCAWIVSAVLSSSLDRYTLQASSSSQFSPRLR